MYLRNYNVTLGSNMNNHSLSGKATAEVMRMVDQSKFDSETLEYFETLPRFVKESIMQSGVEIQNKEDLERCAKNILERPQ